MGKITIKKISLDLNLSRNTVSKALNNDNDVSAKTKLRVLEYVKKNGYTNHSLEVNDKIIEHKNIAIAVLDAKTEFWNRIIVGISEELNKAKISMSLHFINDEKQNAFFDEINGRKLDGIILLSVFEEGFYKQVNQLNIPLISYDLPVFNKDNLLNCSAVFVDTLDSVKEIVEHVHNKGCKTFGFIGHKNGVQTINDRYNAYIISLTELNLHINKNYFICNEKPLKYYGENELEQELDKLDTYPDVFFCYNDDIAIKTVKYLEEKKIKVPEQVSIFGFDDNEFEQQNPKITTIHVSNETIGKKLATMLLLKINGEETVKEKVYIPSYPVFRKSTR